jgi:type II secretion system protein G
MKLNSKFNILNINKGFTLVELLVVIAILGVLATIGLVTFSSSQMRGRDTERKSDLKQIASALEIYYNDYGNYPESGANGLIMACPSLPAPAVACSWDSTAQFTDGKTVYLKTVPKDPSSGLTYFYVALDDDGANQGFRLFAYLENSQDSSINTEIGQSCGSKTCNFSITSPNDVLD